MLETIPSSYAIFSLTSSTLIHVHMWMLAHTLSHTPKSIFKNFYYIFFHLFYISTTIFPTSSFLILPPTFLLTSSPPPPTLFPFQFRKRPASHASQQSKAHQVKVESSYPPCIKVRLWNPVWWLDYQKPAQVPGTGTDVITTSCTNRRNSTTVIPMQRA